MTEKMPEVVNTINLEKANVPGSCCRVRMFEGSASLCRAWDVPVGRVDPQPQTSPESVTT